MHEKTERLNEMVAPNFEVQEVIRPETGFDGWKILRKFQETATVIGMDLLPVALIKKDFAGFHIINQEPDVYEMLKKLAANIEAEFGYKLEVPE